MRSVIRPEGWSTWSGNNHLTSTFAEYHSMDLTGTPLNVSQRVSWSYQLTENDLAGYSQSAWLGGTDGWNPVIDETVYAAADFNYDGAIDGCDFLVWQRGCGLVGQGDNFQEDASGNGVVDAGDLAAWQAAYASTTAALTAVPEPTAGLLFLLAAMGGHITRRSRIAKFVTRPHCGVTLLTKSPQPKRTAPG